MEVVCIVLHNNNLSDELLPLTIGLAKNWLTERSINFCFAIQLQLSARRYIFGNRINNGLLIINQATVPG